MNKLSYLIETFRNHINSRREKRIDCRKYRHVCRYKHNGIIILPDYGRLGAFNWENAESVTHDYKLRKQNERRDNRKIMPPAPYIIIQYFRSIEYVKSTVHPRLTNVREHMFGDNPGERIRVNLLNQST